MNDEDIQSGTSCTGATPYKYLWNTVIVRTQTVDAVIVGRGTSMHAILWLKINHAVLCSENRLKRVLGAGSQFQRRSTAILSGRLGAGPETLVALGPWYVSRRSVYESEDFSLFFLSEGDKQFQNTWLTE